MRKKRYVSPTVHAVNSYGPESAVLSASDALRYVETEGMQVNDYDSGTDFDDAWSDWE